MKMEVVKPNDHFNTTVDAADSRYTLNWFEILTYYKTRFVIYGTGPWHNHLMDWLGMNYYHGRLPGSPVFDSVKDAKVWLKFQIKHGAYAKDMTLPGHHAGEHVCSKGCFDREVETVQYLLK